MGKSEVTRYALRLLAQRDYSTGQLRERIEARFPGQDAEETIAALTAARYLSDQRFAAHLAEKWLRRDKGLLRILADFQRRRFPPEIVAAIEENFDYDQEYAAAGRALKKLSRRKSVPAALRALAARGFSARTIASWRAELRNAHDES